MYPISTFCFPLQEILFLSKQTGSSYYQPNFKTLILKSFGIKTQMNGDDWAEM